MIVPGGLFVRYNVRVKIPIWDYQSERFVAGHWLDGAIIEILADADTRAPLVRLTDMDARILIASAWIRVYRHHNQAVTEHPENWEAYAAAHAFMHRVQSALGWQGPIEEYTPLLADHTFMVPMTPFDWGGGDIETDIAVGVWMEVISDPDTTSRPTRGEYEVWLDGQREKGRLDGLSGRRQSPARRRARR